jgi:hypothetical protein
MEGMHKTTLIRFFAPRSYAIKEHRPKKNLVYTDYKIL